MQEHLTTDSESSSLPTPKARDSQPEGYEAGLRRSQPQVGTVVKAIADGDDRLLLRTPAASEAERGHQPEDKARARGGQVTLSGQFLPTPNTMDHLPARDKDKIDFSKGGHRNVRETVVNELLATPVASEGTKAPAQQTSEIKGKTGQVWLSNQAKDMEQLPTTTASDWKGANHSGSGSASSRGISTIAELFPTLRASDGYERRNQKTMDKIAAEGGDMTMPTLARTETNWGKFEPAIRRWEATIKREAPAPTKPDGKEGAHRLSSKFTEWMMGLPDGWITDVGLSRNDELKACGNGVVPQQAELALRILLDQTPSRIESAPAERLLPEA